MATRNTEKQIFEKALAQAREEDQPGEKARSMLAAPELKNALEDLKRDAPHDQPFVRGIGKLREVKDPGASDRQEQVVAEHPQPNPVGDAPRAKVVVRPRHDPKAHVTSPSIAKREELGLLAPVQVTGKSAAGTMRLKLEGTELQPAVEDVPSPPKHSRLWTWLALVVLLMIGVAALASWGLGGRTEPRTASTEAAASSAAAAGSSAAQPPTSATATETATVASYTPEPSTSATASSPVSSSSENRTATSSNAVTASTSVATPSSGAVTAPPVASSPSTPVTPPRSSTPTTASAKPSSDRLPD